MLSITNFLIMHSSSRDVLRFIFHFFTNCRFLIFVLKEHKQDWGGGELGFFLNEKWTDGGGCKSCRMMIEENNDDKKDGKQVKNSKD